LAGALRDQLKVKLVGEHTFGKGTVQEAQELPGGAGLHVTVAKWLLPSGYNIHLDGIEPDVVVESVFQPEGEEEVDEQLIKAVEVLKG
jgi:carboxyl-terminal processing protease